MSEHRHFRVHPLSPALGAEISGIDLDRPLGDEAAAELRRTWLAHHVLFFRDQSLDIDAHKAFARRFGTLAVDKFVRGLEGHPEIMPVVREAADVRSFANEWHTDTSYLDCPAMASVLYARETPPVGGDTLFANMHLALESLSPGMRAMLSRLRAVHCAAPSYDRAQMDAANAASAGMKYTDRDPREEKSLHPVVRTHPETGRKALYVNSSFTCRFEDMTEEESRPLLHFLLEHLTRPELTCRFRWTPGSLAFWDNRCVQHYPISDYRGHRREMHRLTLAGDRPY